MKKLTVFGVIFSIIMLGWYAKDAYTTLMLVVNTTKGAVSFDIAFKALMAAQPWWWWLCTIGSAVCGILAPILYFCGSVHSSEYAFSVFGLDAVLVALNFITRYTWYTLNLHNWLVAIVAAFITLAYAAYLASCKNTVEYSSEKRWKFLGS